MTRKITKKNAILLTAAAALSLVLTSGMLVQPAFAHAVNIKSLKVEGAGERQITIVLGHSNEPTYGAKPGIHDGKHGVEVFLEDGATALPISGAELKVDKYYFKDFATFKKAKSVKDATEIEKGVTLGGVFGDAGHYVARQVQKDGIYGYRLYGTIHYFSVQELKVDTTVFCRSTEGDTAKFNSPGWFGGFGCTDDIDDILFPTRNSDVNNSGERKTFDVPALNGAAVQQTSLPTDGSLGASSTTNIAAASTSPITANQALASPSLLQLLAMFGVPAAAIAGIVGIRSIRQIRRDSRL